MNIAEAFLANLKHAVRRGDTTCIGGGVFTAAEIAEVISNIKLVRRHSLMGRSFKVLATFPDTDLGAKAANAYMEVHTGASVLEVKDGEIILADKNDSGISL